MAFGKMVVFQKQGIYHHNIAKPYNGVPKFDTTVQFLGIQPAGEDLF
jgi:hypothetical protein